MKDHNLNDNCITHVTKYLEAHPNVIGISIHVIVDKTDERNCPAVITQHSVDSAMLNPSIKRAIQNTFEASHELIGGSMNSISSALKS